MVAKIKPAGLALGDFCFRWDTASAQEKRQMCQEYGVTYDTLRHWRSDSSGIYPIPKPEPPEEIPDTAPDVVREVLSMPRSTELKFVSFDIETSNLKADFSIMLSACIKPYGEEPIVFRADDYDSWDTNREDDSQIVVDIAEELKKYAVVITHYGTRFDLPYMRAKMVKHGIPNLPPMFGVDTLQIARQSFAVSSRRLKSLAAYLDLGSKTEVEGSLWLKAAYSGDRQAMDAIVEHNIVDCEVLERLASLCFPFLRSMKRL